MTRDALLARLTAYDRVVEVGIGRETTLARELAATDVDVTATDVRDRPVPDDVTFVRDDITDPHLSLYRGADAIFAHNLPPELHRPTRDVARAVDATFLFTTLGGDPPLVDVTAAQIPGDTVYVG